MPPGVPAPKPTNAALPLVPLLLLSWFFPSEAAAPAAAAAAAAAAEVPSTERGAIDVGVASRPPPWLLAPPPGASGLLPASPPFSLPLSSLLLLDGEAPSSPPLPPFEASRSRRSLLRPATRALWRPRRRRGVRAREAGRRVRGRQSASSAGRTKA